MDCEQDLFIYITTEYYTLKKFYNVIINTGISKKLIIGYGQYLVYKAINDYININTIQIKAVNI